MTRVMVVDRDPALGAALQRMLRGYSVEIVATGRAALERIAVDGTDVIVCELELPDLTYAMFLTRLESLSTQLSKRVVFMSVGELDPRTSQGLNVLIKPFRTAALRDAVAELAAQCSPGLR